MIRVGEMVDGINQMTFLHWIYHLVYLYYLLIEMILLKLKKIQNEVLKRS